MGYLPEQSAIYIVLRGSVSFQNWVDDFDALQVPFNNSDCTDCYVHQGFNYAWNQVAKSVLSDVLELRKQFPDYSIIVTGHSLGGALASLCAITLQEFFNKEASVSNKFSLRAMQKLHIIPKVRLFTFGAPRFSNEALAAYTTMLLSDRNRITHYKDMAPHCPPYLQYMHIEGEYFTATDAVGVTARSSVEACIALKVSCITSWFRHLDHS
jgi:predicted lipase